MAVRNLERSLGENRPRALIQMATGSGKTLLAAYVSYRLIKFANACRILFLVDRANLGRQTLKEFQAFTTPDDGRKFTELYNVQHMSSNRIDPVARVTISTIQRLYSTLKGEPELDPEIDEHSAYELVSEPVPVEYNPAVPIETFDVVIVDECHRSIYGLWRQVRDYFDAFVIGLTATPNKQAFGFFNQNLVMEYTQEEAVADAVNVDFDVYRIRTEITEEGSTIEAGIVTGFRDRLPRKLRWEQLEEDFPYDPDALDRKVVAKDQLRTVVRAFRDKLFTEIFPGRTDVPKTLVFAKDDSHADDIVQIVREEFGKGADFAVKITYKSTGKKPDEMIAEFRNSYHPRIAVTVDMIATGTDVRPLECVSFMRAVKSRTYFEQMKGRGVRVIIAEDHYERLIKHAVRSSDIVVASLGDEAPRACLVPHWLGPAIVKADCIRVRTSDGVGPRFLMWTLNSPQVRAQAATSIKGVGRPRLGLGGIKRLSVPIPPLHEQRRIVPAIEERFSRLDAAEESLRRGLERLTAFVVRPCHSLWQPARRGCSATFSSTLKLASRWPGRRSRTGACAVAVLSEEGE